MKRFDSGQERDIITWALLKARRMGMDCGMFEQCQPVLEEKDPTTNPATKKQILGLSLCRSCTCTDDMMDLVNHTLHSIEVIYKHKREYNNNEQA